MPLLLALLLSFLPYVDSPVDDGAQEKPAKQYPKLVAMGLSLWERLKQPDPKLETEWIYQPQKGFGVGLGYELTQMGVSLSSQTSSVMDTDGKMVANFDFRLAPYFNWPVIMVPSSSTTATMPISCTRVTFA